MSGELKVKKLLASLASEKVMPGLKKSGKNHVT